MNFVIGLDDHFVVVVKRHFDQKLQQRELVGKLMVKPFLESLQRELGEHTVDELVKGKVFVRHHVVSRYGGLQHLVGPRALPEHHSRAYLIVASCEDFLHFRDVARLDFSIDFKGRCGSGESGRRGGEREPALAAQSFAGSAQV